MSLSLYLPLYTEDVEIAALLYQAGSIDKLLGCGIFYYPLYLCPAERGKVILLDPLGGGVKVSVLGGELEEAINRLDEGMKSITAPIQVLTDLKFMIERLALEDLFIDNVVSDPLVLADVRSYIKHGNFDPIRGAQELLDWGDEEMCRGASALDEVKSKLILRVTALDEVIEKLGEMENFTLKMLDKEKKLALEKHREEYNLLKKEWERKLEEVEEKAEKDKDRLFKMEERMRARLEPRMKKLEKRQRDEEKKAVIYEERYKNTGKERWRTLARRHAEMASKWQNKLSELEKELDKKHDEVMKGLRSIEHDIWEMGQRKEKTLKEKEKEKEKIIWDIDYRKDHIKTLCSEILGMAKRWRSHQIQVLETLDSYSLMMPMEGKMKIYIPFIALRRAVKMGKPFLFLFHSVISPTKVWRILTFWRSNIAGSIRPAYKYLIPYLKNNLYDHIEKLTPRLIEGASEPRLPNQEFSQEAMEGVKKLASMNLVKLEKATDCISKMMEVSKSEC